MAATPPVVVLTSNRTRELHDALKRRCLYHWIDHPGLDREVAIVRSRAPEVSEALARQIVTVVQQLRDRDDLEKPPGVAETLDWARALHTLGTTELDLESSARTLGALVKYREDAERVRQALDQMLRRMNARRRVLLGFARALRAAGVPVTQDRAQTFLDAAAVVGLDDRRATYAAGRATLCSSPDDLVRYDQVFEAYFNARDGLPRARPATPERGDVRRPAR